MNININYEDPSFQHDEYEKVIDQIGRASCRERV